MEYKGLYISYTKDNGVRREIDGVEQECEGLYFQVYADKDMQYEIDNFCGAFGVDLENTEKSIDEYAKDIVDYNLECFVAEQRRVQTIIKKHGEAQTNKQPEEKMLLKRELPEKRVREILSGALDWISELLRGRELYGVLKSSFGMTNEEIKNEGFDLENYYEDEDEIEI